MFRRAACDYFSFNTRAVDYCADDLAGTFCNYLGYLRAACLALGEEAPPTADPAIKRAVSAIAKRELSEARPKMFIRKQVLPRAPPLWNAPGLSALGQAHGLSDDRRSPAASRGTELGDVVADGLHVPPQGAVGGVKAPAYLHILQPV